MLDDFSAFALTHFPGLLPQHTSHLLQISDGPLERTPASFLRKFWPHKPPEFEESWNAFLKTLPTLKRDFERYQAQGLGMVTCFSEDYPEALKQIPAAPLVLFYQGDLSVLHGDLLLGVVGTRRITSYGKAIMEDVIPKVCEAGLTTVSGLAFGVDAWAHELTLKARQKTVAVLARGVDQASPARHQRLFEKILHHGGCVVSEFPFSRGIQAYDFPRRNRIISGLSQGTLVVEAPVKSGALITAHYAVEQNRNVYAVPGSLQQKMSEGCLQLIQQGATMVRDAKDILQDYDVCLEEQRQPELPMLSGIEKRIFEYCAEEPRHFDEILDAFPQPAAELSVLVSKLEIKGCLKNLGQAQYASQI